MTLGQQIISLRKKNSLSQSDLGKVIGTSGDIIGRYERDEVKPSIDVVIKIADALNVSIDFLVGKTEIELDKQTMKRIEEIGRLPKDSKNFVYNLVDMAIRDFRNKQAYANS
jgi:transcriptional regulator with XRE-family HTH domain